ncbi:MAG: hypothetical protein PHP75_05250 [Methylacidiphilaceae bacterium]|nr:hypothetical protein [Candidatus Methylacidiphilaceae bacterium]
MASPWQGGRAPQEAFSGATAYLSSPFAQARVPGSEAILLPRKRPDFLR